MQQFLKFIFGIELCMFRRVRLSIVSSPALCTAKVICHTGYAVCLLASCQHNVIRIYQDAQFFECQIPQTCCVAFKKSFVLANINIPGTSHDAGVCQKSVDMVQYSRTIWVGGMGRTSWTSLSPAETIERSSRITNRYTQNALTSTVKLDSMPRHWNHTVLKW